MCDVHVRRQQRRQSGVWFRLYVSPLLRRSSVRRLCLLTCRVREGETLPWWSGRILQQPRPRAMQSLIAKLSVRIIYTFV